MSATLDGSDRAILVGLAIALTLALVVGLLRGGAPPW